MNIRFRYISINTSNNEVSGFILCYDSLQDAQSFFDVLMNAYKHGIKYKTLLKFQNSDSTEYNMILVINGGEYCYQIEISGIDHIFIDKLCESIKNNGYVYILTAQSKTEQELKLVKSGYLCISRFFVNEVQIEGCVNNTEFPIKELNNFVRY